MHPYYGSDRLVTASPTLIESVESEETEMHSNNGTGATPGHGHAPLYSTSAVATHLGLGLSSTQVSGSGVMGSQFPMSIYPYTPYTTHYQPVPIVTHALMAQAGHSAGLSSSSPPMYNGYNPPYMQTSYTPTSITTSTPYLPIPTSTRSVQFMTPSTAQESLNTYTNRIYSPRVSPTYSNPPIQMVAPRPDSVLWQHAVPTSMPWAPVGTSSSNIHFTATSTSTLNSTNMASSNPKRLIKRKSTFDDTAVPEKVHVNEERMAARLETLHLDNNNLQWHPDLEDQWYSQKQDSTSCTASTTTTTSPTHRDDKEKEDRGISVGGVEDVTRNRTDSNRLNFSDLLKMGIKSQEILPKLIMDEINKPCMQVVLWKPPGNFVKNMVRDVGRDVSPEITSEMNDIGNGDSDVNNDVMETVSPSLSSLSWKPPVKTSDSMGMDDMEL